MSRQRSQRDGAVGVVVGGGSSGVVTARYDLHLFRVLPLERGDIAEDGVDVVVLLGIRLEAFG